MPSLDDCRARITFAEDHINSLQATVKRFLDKNQCAVRYEKSRKPHKMDIRVYNVPEIPREVSINVGMIAHNMRSALDGLACQLTLLNAESGCAESVCANTMFPIRIHGPDSKVRSKSNRHERKFSWTSDNFLPIGRYLASLEELQPYKSGNGHRKNPLWLLDRLNNADKHRTLVLLPVEGSSVGIGFDPDGPPVQQLHVDGPFSLRPGRRLTERAKIGEIDTDSPLNVKMYMKIRAKVAFGQGCRAVERMPVFKTLRQIRSHVSDIVESFAPEFPAT